MFPITMLSLFILPALATLKPQAGITAGAPGYAPPVPAPVSIMLAF